MRVTTTAAYFMQSVAIGWQIYDMTGNPLDLGLVGLVQFFPLVLLAVVVGQIIDRYDRRAIARACQIVKAVCAIVLALGSAGGWLGRDAIFGVLLVVGTARAFETPTLHALVPGLVPPLLLPRAIAASATANQTAIICGPALGGLIYAFGPTTVYLTCAVIFVAASVLVSLLPRDMRPRERKPVTLQNLFGGFSYIRHHPILLGAHLARPVRGDARRRHRAAADLCARRAADRAVGSRPAALGAGGRRARDVGRAGPCGDRAARRGADVRHHRRVRASRPWYSRCRPRSRCRSRC